ncbi:hypothetical protein A2U01_0057728, partial [Trifolium medium]|nr:hypothetical protein [Trifolium medium]
MTQEVPSATKDVIPLKVQSELAIVVPKQLQENVHDNYAEGDIHSGCNEQDPHIDSNKHNSSNDRNSEPDKDDNADAAPVA